MIRSRRRALVLATAALTACGGGVGHQLCRGDERHRVDYRDRHEFELGRRCGRIGLRAESECALSASDADDRAAADRADADCSGVAHEMVYDAGGAGSFLTTPW